MRAMFYTFCCQLCTCAVGHFCPGAVGLFFLSFVVSSSFFLCFNSFILRAAKVSAVTIIFYGLACPQCVFVFYARWQGQK